MKIKDAIKNGKIPNVKIESIFQSLERLGINVSKNSRTAEYDLEDKIIDKFLHENSKTIEFFWWRLKTRPPLSEAVYFFCL